MERKHIYENILNEYEKKARVLFAKDPQRLQELEALKKENLEGKLSNYDYREVLVRWLTEGKFSFQSEETASKLKALAKQIQEMQNKAQKRSKKLFFVAIAELPFVVLITITVYALYVRGGAIKSWDLLTIAIPILLVAIIHSHILFRFYQQSISSQKELHEKQLGVTFLEAAFLDSPSNLKLYELGMQMFLQHHISVEPYGAKDKIVSINLGKVKDE